MKHTEARESFQQIVDLLAEISLYLDSASIADAVAWDLPILSDPVAPDCVNPVARRIERGNDLASILGNIYYQPGQHPATVARHPGYVLLNQVDDAFFYAVDALNAAKDDLHARIKQIPVGSRAPFARQAFPGVSMLQVYRHVFAYENCPRQLLFTWAGNTAASRRLPRQEVIELIRGSRFSAPEHIEPGDWLSVIDAELRQIDNLPADTHFALRKLIAPHPRLMVYFTERPRHDLNLHANLPVFFACRDRPLPVIKPLKPFDRDQRYAARKDRKAWRPIIERIGLFAV